MDQRSQGKHNRATLPSQKNGDTSNPSPQAHFWTFTTRNNKRDQKVLARLCTADTVYAVHCNIHFKHPPWSSLLYGPCCRQRLMWCSDPASLLPGPLIPVVHTTNHIRCYPHFYSQQSGSYRMIHKECVLCICCYAYQMRENVWK